MEPLTLPDPCADTWGDLREVFQRTFAPVPTDDPEGAAGDSRAKQRQRPMANNLPTSSGYFPARWQISRAATERSCIVTCTRDKPATSRSRVSRVVPKGDMRPLALATLLREHECEISRPPEGVEALRYRNCVPGTHVPDQRTILRRCFVPGLQRSGSVLQVAARRTDKAPSLRRIPFRRFLGELDR